MSNQINYKQKYQELKMKFMQSVDAAFRMGMEQGLVQGQQQAQMQAQQQQAEMQAQQAGGGAAPGQEGHGSDGSPPGADQMGNPNMTEATDSQNPAGSEFDQHIEKLEGMLGKSELSPAELLGAVQDMRKAQAKIKEAAELKKSSIAISGIAKALHKPAFKIAQNASHNMNSSAKNALSLQEKIVSDVMKSWESEETEAAKAIRSVINIETLTKKE